MTSQPLNTASLFQTSLRRWQAEWRANRGGTAASPAAVGRRLIGASPARRRQRPAGQAMNEAVRA